jgi:heat shock protein HtpX
MAVFAVLAMVMVFLSYAVLLAIAAGCLMIAYLAFRSESANLQVLAASVFAVAIAGALLWSLFPRRDNFTAPGPLLDRESQPRLFAELEHIAACLHEPLPREVYLIGDMNAWVADRGGIMGFGARRIMGLGLPLLSLLKISQFRAVLAHEFAHYYGGDTRLGPWVYKTRTAIVRVFENVGSLRKLARIAVLQMMYLLVTTLLKWYFILFMRITNLVSRRQEFRADELACIIAGRQPLIDGLQIINSAGAAWPTYWQTEVAPLLDSGAVPGIGEGFASFVAVPDISLQITTILQKQLERTKGDPYDTHPLLQERIRAAGRIAPSAPELESQPARSLLDDPTSLELNFLRAVFPALATEPLKYVAWDDVAEEVLVPARRDSMKTHGPLFQSLTMDTVPEALTRLDLIGETVPNPKGILLSGSQRRARASELLGIAAALSLIDHGWRLEARPGFLHLQKDAAQLNPFRAVNELIMGTRKSEEWAAHCRELGIAGYRLGFSYKFPGGANPAE